MARFASHLGLDRTTLVTSVRAAVATTVSLLLARGLKLDEFYWAPISTIVILLSTVNPLALAWQRFAGTALGAALGAVIASHFSPNWMVYATGILVCGVACAILRLSAAYRFAAITLTIVLLVNHHQGPWTIALHRFIEVSLGIAVGLAAGLLWPLALPKRS